MLSAQFYAKSYAAQMYYTWLSDKVYIFISIVETTY